MSALTETAVLLSALRLNQTAEAWQAECAQAGLNWDALAVRAMVLGLAPQLRHRLTEWGISEAIPSRAAAKLAVTYQRQDKRNAAIFAQLGEVLSACATRGLRPIALKGVHLAAWVYATPALRPMNDIDLLFAPEELPEAGEVLASLGYGGKHRSADIGPGVVKHTSTFRREGQPAATPNPYLSTDAECMIEPHGSLEESWFGLKVDITPGVRERAVDAALGGQPGRVLAREDLLLHLCVHFCFHFIAGSPAMVQLADLKTVTADGELGWPTFVEQAVARRAAPFALAALTLAQRLLDAPVEVALDGLARATPTHLRSQIAKLDLKDILQRTQQKPLTGIGERITRGFSDRVAAARWAYDWHDHWQVWQTALRLSRTDTGHLILDTLSAKLRKKQV
jgi:hypothetical protein